MSDLKARIGRKAGEKHFPNKSWVRPGFEASSPKRVPRVWNTTNRTIEDDSDTGSHDSQAYSPPHSMPVSPTDAGSPSKPSLLDRMNTPISPKSLHRAQKTLMERLSYGRKLDGTFETEFESHNSEEGMDIDRDSDSVISSDLKDQTLKENKVAGEPLDSRMDSLPDFNQRAISTVSTAHNQFLTSRNNDPVNHQGENLDSHHKTGLHEPVQNGIGPTHSNSSSLSNTNRPPPRPSTLDHTNNVNKVMAQDKIQRSQRNEDGELRSPLSADQVRVVLLPLMLQTAESRIKHAELKATSSQHATVNPKVLTDLVCASFSEIGQTIRKEIKSRDPPRRSPPRVAPSNAHSDANTPIASTSTDNRVQSSRRSQERDHVQNTSTYNQRAGAVSSGLDMIASSAGLPARPQDGLGQQWRSKSIPTNRGPSQRRSPTPREPRVQESANRVQSSRRSQEREQIQKSSAYNQRVNSVSNGPDMTTSTAGLPARPQDTFGQWQSNSTPTNRGLSQRRSPGPEEPRVQDREQRRASEPRNDERRPRTPPRGPPYARGPPERRSAYGHERRASDREYDYSRPRRPLTPPPPPPRTSYIPDQRYDRSPVRRSRSRSRDSARIPHPSRGRGDYSHNRGYSHDDYRTRQKPGPYMPHNTNRSRSRSPFRRGPRTPSPRDRKTYRSSRSRSPPRRGPRTPPPRGSYRPRTRSPQSRGPGTPPSRGSYRPRTRSPQSRGPGTPPSRANSSRMATRSPLFDRRPRSNERSNARDLSVGMSMLSNRSTSKESTVRPQNMSSAESDQEQYRPPSYTPESTETQGTVEPHFEPILPCHNVPGLWFVKMALDNLGTLNCEFQIDHETAVKWSIAQTNNNKDAITNNDSMQISRKRLSLQVCSYSKQLVQDVIQRLGAEQTPANITNAILALEQSWPNQGQLIVTVNPDKGEKKTWLPHKLRGNNPPIQIENHVREGDNIVQFVQLSGMSDCLFALCASERVDDPVSVLPSRPPIEGPSPIDSVEVIIIP